MSSSLNGIRTAALRSESRFTRSPAIRTSDPFFGSRHSEPKSRRPFDAINA